MSEIQMENSCFLCRHDSICQVLHLLVLYECAYNIYKAQKPRVGQSSLSAQLPNKETLTYAHISMVNITDQTSWLFRVFFFHISAGMFFGFV